MNAIVIFVFKNQMNSLRDGLGLYSKATIQTKFARTLNKSQISQKKQNFGRCLINQQKPTEVKATEVKATQEKPNEVKATQEKPTQAKRWMACR